MGAFRGRGCARSSAGISVAVVAAVRSRPEDRLPGLLIDGRYRVEHVVGAGGFGTVYSAIHLGLGARVALKVLTVPEHLRPEQLVKLVGGFLEEARTLKRLRHPGIVAAHDVGLLPADENGLQLPYLVMEWCGGPTLKQLLDRRGGQPIGLDDAFRLFAPLLDSMAYAHAAGVVHRDLKPANVIIEEVNGALVPRVIDFGAAKMIAPDEAAGSGDTRTSSGSSPWTLRYAAPEQLAGARTGPWTDVHALGLIFVEMVTGRPAIGDGVDARMAVIDPVRPTPKAHGVDVGALEAVLARALALRPADRHPDAAALAAAMSAVAAAGWPGALDIDPRHPPSRTPHLPRAHDIDASESRPSNTFVTLPAAHAPVPRRPPRRRLVATIAALTLGLGAAAGGVRWHDRWPFAPMRLRDLSGAELERRAVAANLGTCSSSPFPGGHFVSCEHGLLYLFQTKLPLSMSRGEVRAHVNSIALGMAQNRAARFAIDGDRALILIAPAQLLTAVVDTVLGSVTVDVHTADEPPPVKAERSEAARLALAAWTGDDLVASVREVALHISYANRVGPAPTVTTYQNGNSSVITLYMRGGREALDAWRARGASPPMAYALDGGKLIVVAGDAGLTSVEFIRKILAGARAAEIGVHPR